MEISPKEDILAHVLDITHGKINTEPVISVIQSRDIEYPFNADMARVPTAMVITRANQTFEVYMILLTDDHSVSVNDSRVISYGSHDNYPIALQIALFYGIIDK